MENTTTPETGPGAPALFTVERGNPTTAELAALTAVVLALGNGQDEEEPATASRGERLRRQSRRGRQLAGLPGSWRSGRF